MLSFYGSKISPNQARSPEGYLILLNVPIARTGIYEYLGAEIGHPEKDIVRVYRSPDEVFSDASMASFQGKAATDEHPPQELTPANTMAYMRGSAQNIRRGEGTESDLLLSDLLIYDPTLDSEIEQKIKKEISCGYECEYVFESGEINGQQYDAVQRNIIGNHVAVVRHGRAGGRVAIKDTKPKGVVKRVGKIDKNSLWGKMLAKFATDADPEEMAAAAQMMAGKDEEEAPAQQAKEDETGKQILAAIQGLTARVEALEKSDKQVHEEISPLDALEKELTDEKPVAEEQKPAAQVIEPEKKPEGIDKAAAMDALKEAKMIVAAIPEGPERKKAADALATLIRGKAQPGGAYAQMAAAGTKDTKPQQVNPADVGKDIAAKHNPRYRKDGGK